MDTVGQGEGVAVLFNARAKQVTAETVKAMRKALPKALVLVSEDFEQARRHAKTIVNAKPWLFVPAGGDGSVVRALNMLREVGGGKPFPALGLLKMGTGNAWSNVVGATDYMTAVRVLPTLRKPLPTVTFHMVEAEGQLCPFAGVGWDARLVNDYYRNLDKRSSQLVGAGFSWRLHKSMYGYLHSLFTITVPEEVVARRTQGPPRVVVESVGEGEVFTLDERANAVPVKRDAAGRVPMLYEGPVSVAGGSTCTELGFRFKAFPFANKVPGWLNVRVYDASALQATARMLDLWSGKHPMEGMHDFYVKKVRMRFSRPMPMQIGGDGVGDREELELAIANETVDVVDWGAALPAAEHVAPEKRSGGFRQRFRRGG